MSYANFLQGKYERLPMGQIEDNFGDLAKCEGLWISDKFTEPEMLNKYLTVSVETINSLHEHKISIDTYYDALADGRTISTPISLFRLVTTKSKCPLCGSSYDSFAISRRDNTTEICSECGLNEALSDFGGYR